MAFWRKRKANKVERVIETAPGPAMYACIDVLEFAALLILHIPGHMAMERLELTQRAGKVRAIIEERLIAENATSRQIPTPGYDPACN